MTDDDVPRTIGEFGRLNDRLGMRCNACGRFRYLNAGRYRSDDVVTDISRRLKCYRCLSTEVEALCVRVDVATGRWPAEAS